MDAYGRAHGIAVDRARRWLSVVSLAGALEGSHGDDGPQFLIKGGTSMELRLGLRARTTKDVDIVFRGDPDEMLEALEQAFQQPYGGFSFRRKGPVQDIRDTGSRRLALQVEFGGRDWQTLQLEVAPPEAAEPELVPVAISIADFKLDAPERVACLSLPYQVAQKLHAVTERPHGRVNHRYWGLIDLILLRELLGKGLSSVQHASRPSHPGRPIHGRRNWKSRRPGTVPMPAPLRTSKPTCRPMSSRRPKKSACSSHRLTAPEPLARRLRR